MGNHNETPSTSTQEIGIETTERPGISNTTKSQIGHELRDLDKYPTEKKKTEELRRKIRQAIKELRLSICVKMLDSRYTMPERIEQVIKLYEKIDQRAGTTHYDKKEHIEILKEYKEFIANYKADENKQQEIEKRITKLQETDEQEKKEIDALENSIKKIIFGTEFDRFDKISTDMANNYKYLKRNKPRFTINNGENSINIRIDTGYRGDINRSEYIKDLIFGFTPKDMIHEDKIELLKDLEMYIDSNFNN